MVHHQEPAAVGGGGGQVSALHEKQQLDDELFCRQARAHAEALFDQHHSTSAQSKAAWDSGDHRLAKQLSDESKQLRRAAEIASLAAARKIFDMKNSRVQPEEIDLHGLHVDEAVKFTEERIDLDVNSSKELVIVIYGAGHHSASHTQKLKPAVLQLLGRKGLAGPNHCREDFDALRNKPNPGCVSVFYHPENGGGAHRQQQQHLRADAAVTIRQPAPVVVSVGQAPMVVTTPAKPGQYPQQQKTPPVEDSSCLSCCTIM